jgi:aminopeptidase N
MNRLSRILSMFVIAFTATLAHAQAPFAFDDTPGHLPKDVVPIEYRLHLVPDIAGRTFRGSQQVAIEVLRPTSQIVLNALMLEIDAASLEGRGLARTVLGAPQIDPASQTLTFRLRRALAPGRYTLAIAWRGTINAAPEGLYVDPYRAAGRNRLVLATDLEPTHARRVLPCWDEPAFRARYRLSVDLPMGYTAYSNMPVTRRQTRAAGLQRVAFAPTPRMPSYLLALVAGVGMEREAAVVDGTRIGVVTTAGKRFAARYALDVTKQLLPYYNDYFGIRYPLPKLDHIAVPGGFGGGMENWGAIVYNETALLVDPKGSPESTRQDVFRVVSHELAHQWFGNLVTMAWWDDLWLNEGFAEWMGNKAADRLNPQWHVWLHAAGGREWAMDLDARQSTHPIQQAVVHDTEATDAFDRITYQKGSGFLRMLETYLGEADFRDGLRRYMVRHRYSNTTTTDLWTALAETSGKPVAKIASDWTTQPGFPVVDVDARCEAGRRHITLRQEQFRSGDDDPPGQRLWSVPVQLGRVGADQGDFALLQTRTSTLVQQGCDGTLLIDPDNVGYYRVRYAAPLFEAITAQWSALPDGARFKLLADSSALVQAGRMPLAQYVGLLRGLGTEPRLAVWHQVLRDLVLFDRLGSGEPARQALHRFAVRLIAPRFAQLGWDEKPGESAEDRQLRGELARALAWYGDAAAIAEGRARFWRFVADPSSLPPSLVDGVVDIAGRHADQATYDALKRLAEQALTSEQKFRFYRAAASALHPALAAQSLQLSTASEVPQIIRNEIAADVARSGHLDAAWDHARRTADARLADMTRGDANRYFGDIVETSASASRADELEAFVAARNLAEGALVNARRTGDEIRTRARLKARLWPQLEATLSIQSP